MARSFITSCIRQAVCSEANTHTKPRLLSSGLHLAMFFSIAILIFSGRTTAQGRAGEGEVEVVGTVDAADESSVGEVEVVGTVDAADESSVGEVEVVGTVDTAGESSVGEVEVVGTVDAADESSVGEVEVVGTVDTAGESSVGEVEVVGTIAFPRTVAQLSSWAQIKLLQESGFR
jgi:hypothetical protein